MIRSHKIRLNPTPEQAQYFRQAAGVKRFVFNWAIDAWKAAKAAGRETYGPMALKKDEGAIKREQYPFVLDVAKDVAEGAFADFAKALTNYFTARKGLRKGKAVGFVQYKSRKKSKPTFRLNNDKITLVAHAVRVPKLGLVNMAESLRYEGKVQGAVVSFSAGYWWIAVVVDVEQPAAVSHPRPSVGVDLGLKTLATLSDGTQFENQKLLRSELNQIKKANRAVARRTVGSKRRERAKQKLARLHYRIACKRGDVIHKMTTQIARSYRVVGVEDLNVSGMVKNRRLALSLADASLGEILRQLDYKTDWYGGICQKVSRWYPSSKTCGVCGWKNETLRLADRFWTCEECGTRHERDVNASRNIEKEALRCLGA